MDLTEHLVPIHPPWAGTPSITQGCSKPHPIWPDMVIQVFFKKGNHRKEYENLNLFLMPSSISTECSQHCRGSRRSGIRSLFLDSEALLPVYPVVCYSFPNGRTAIELV